MVGAEEEERVSSGGGGRGAALAGVGGTWQYPHSLPVARGGFEQQERPEGRNEAWAGACAEAPGAPAPCRRLQLRVAARLWPQPPISASGVTPPSPPLRPISLSFHLIRIHVIAFGAHLDNPGHSPHFKIPNSIASATISPHAVTLTGSRD